MALMKMPCAVGTGGGATLSYIECSSFVGGTPTSIGIAPKEGMIVIFDWCGYYSDASTTTTYCTCAIYKNGSFEYQKPTWAGNTINVLSVLNNEICFTQNVGSTQVFHVYVIEP